MIIITLVYKYRFLEENSRGTSAAC